MLKQRIITALLLLAVFLPALFHPDPIWLSLAGLVLVAAGSWEWGQLNGLSPLTALLMPFICVLICLAMWRSGAVLQIPAYFWIMSSIFWLILSVICLKNGVNSWRFLPQFVRNFLGIVILIVTWAALYRAKITGTSFLLSVLLLVWVADISAYFVGKKWGKHKLAPSISPGKSREGLAGGVVGVFLLALGWIALEALFPDLKNSVFSMLYSKGLLFMLFGILFLTLMSAAGDLFESLMKRSAGMKDSSRLLPGHGGVLDRLDALLPTLPLAVMLSLF
jgi:phosphatidate cytidylyltransferase